MDVIAPNMFAGSVLDPEPGTAYEVQLVLSDPDGVRGESRRVVSVRTRSEPMPYIGGRTFHVYPHGFKGPKIEPSFEGLMCAYNEWCAGSDWARSGRPRVRAGDTILVHAALYKYNRYEYTNDASVNRAVPLDGTYYLTADGTPDMPISIVAAGDGEVIFDGNGNFALFDVAYHLPAGSTWLTNGAAGVLFYNNTVLSETAAAATSNTHWRNNLFLGENALPTIFGVTTTFTNYTSSDYNGFRPNPGAATSFEWNSPPASTLADFTGPGHNARLETRRFATLADYTKSTGQDSHSLIVDYDVFVEVPRLDAQDSGPRPNPRR